MRVLCCCWHFSFALLVPRLRALPIRPLHTMHQALRGLHGVTSWLFENQVFARCSSSSLLQFPSPQWCVSKWPLNYMSTVCFLSGLVSPKVKAVRFCVLCLVLGQSLACVRCLGNSCGIGLNLHADLWNHTALLSPFPPRCSSPSASPDHSLPAVLWRRDCVVWSGFVSSLPTNFCF